MKASCILIVVFALNAEATGRMTDEEKLPYPSYPEECRAVTDLIHGKGRSDLVLEGLDLAIADVIVKDGGRDLKKIRELFTLRKAAELFSNAKDPETATLLFSDPSWCSRFLHNMDRDDNLDGALRVIRTLHDFESRTMADVLAMARRKLFDLYTAEGNTKKAKKYEKYRGS